MLGGRPVRRGPLDSTGVSGLQGSSVETRAGGREDIHKPKAWKKGPGSAETAGTQS